MTQQTERDALRKLAEAANTTYEERADMQHVAFWFAYSALCTFKEEASAAKVIELLDAMDAQALQIAELGKEVERLNHKDKLITKWTENGELIERLYSAGIQQERELSTLRAELDAIRKQEPIKTSIAQQGSTIDGRLFKDFRVCYALPGECPTQFYAAPAQPAGVNAELVDALEKIASPTQTTGLLWWQIEARTALSNAKAAQQKESPQSTHPAHPTDPLEAA
jgi:hypothetical protein